MSPNVASGLLAFCLLFGAQAQRSDAQQPPQQQQSTQQPQTTPPPKPSQQQPASTQQPAPSHDRDTGGDALSIEPIYWLNQGQPKLLRGKKDTTNVPGNLDFPGKSKAAIGGVITIPTTHENSLQLSYFQAKGSGDTTATQDVNFFGQGFTQGDLLATQYRVQNFKLSWNYLSYPYPSNGAKFRLKTLWEVQYTSVKSSIDAPLDASASTASGTKSIIYPTLGLGIELHPSRHLRLEAKASGFGFPHKANSWDAEGSAVLRVGKLEVFIGGKGFHFKTSPQADQYLSGTLWGPYAGLRWVFR